MNLQECGDTALDRGKYMAEQDDGLHEVQYLVSVVVNSVHADRDNWHLDEEVEVTGATDGVYVTYNLIEAERIARFLGGIGLRIPPIDAVAAFEEDLSDAGL